MKTSFKILLLSCLLPFLYTLIANGILRYKYEQGDMLNSEEIHALKYASHSLPQVNQIRIENISRLPIIYDGACKLELEKSTDRKNPVHFSIVDSTLVLRQIKGSGRPKMRNQNAILHLPSGVKMEAEDCRLNIALRNDDVHLDISGKDNSIHFIHDYPASSENPITEGPNGKTKYQSKMAHLNLDLEDSSISFPQNFVLDSLSGNCKHSQIMLSHIRLNKYNLEVDATSTVTLPGHILAKLSQ